MADRNKETGNQRRSMIALGVIVLLFLVGPRTLCRQQDGRLHDVRPYQLRTA
jgi:hypothetical protein